MNTDVQHLELGWEWFIGANLKIFFNDKVTKKTVKVLELTNVAAYTRIHTTTSLHTIAFNSEVGSFGHDVIHTT